MRHFYIDPSAATKPLITIEGSEAHHIKNVLRLKTGDYLKLYDGTGCEYVAVIAGIEAEKVEAEIQRKYQSHDNSSPRILVAQAFLKEKKMDALVRKLSELGIAGLMPFFSQRSIARPDKKRLAGRIQRWQRIAVEALKQCRRKSMLDIAAPLTFDELMAFSSPCDLKILFWEKEAAPLSRRIGTNAKMPLNTIILMLGPEGGFSGQEVDMARQSGFVTAGLGPRILRAETAALAASTLIQYLFGDMGS